MASLRQHCIIERDPTHLQEARERWDGDRTLQYCPAAAVAATELAIARSRPASRPRGCRAVGSGQHRWWLWSARSKCRLVYIMATAQRFRLTPRAGGTFDLGPFAVSPPLLRCCRRRHAAHCTAATRPDGGASYSERNTLLQQLFLLTGEWVLHGEFQLLHIDQIR